MDQPAKFEKESTAIPPLYAVIIAFALGAVATVLAFMEFEWYFAVIPGALGIVAGTYSLRTARTIENGKTLMVLAAAATALSVVGFMLGITLLN
jgi:hypothetical protein